MNFPYLEIDLYWFQLEMLKKCTGVMQTAVLDWGRIANMEPARGV